MQSDHLGDHPALNAISSSTATDSWQSPSNATLTPPVKQRVRLPCQGVTRWVRGDYYSPRRTSVSCELKMFTLLQVTTCWLLNKLDDSFVTYELARSRAVHLQVLETMFRVFWAFKNQKSFFRYNTLKEGSIQKPVANTTNKQEQQERMLKIHHWRWTKTTGRENGEKQVTTKLEKEERRG